MSASENSLLPISEPIQKFQCSHLTTKFLQTNPNDVYKFGIQNTWTKWGAKFINLLVSNRLNIWWQIASIDTNYNRYRHQALVTINTNRQARWNVFIPSWQFWLDLTRWLTAAKRVFVLSKICDVDFLISINFFWWHI